MRMCRFLVKCFLLACLGVAFVDQAHSAEPSESAAKAESLVAEALLAEISGNVQARHQLLSQADQLAEDFAPAHWHLGRLLDSDNSWRSIEDSIEKYTDDDLLDRYEQNRSQLVDSVDSHWQLASWCASRGLKQQCLAHLQRVVQLDSNHVGARIALGHILVAGQWLTLEDQESMEQRARQAQLSFEKYGKKLSLLFTRLTSVSPKAAEKAKAQLMAIRDPLAVTTVESLVVGQADPMVEIVVSWLDSIDDPAASLALARFALLHPSSDIQESAIERLKSKDFYDFIPELLAMLSGPVQFMAVPFFDRQGNFIGYRQAFSQEGMNEVQLSITERGFQRVQVQRLDTLPMNRIQISQRMPSRPLRGFANQLRELDLIQGVENILMDQMINQMSIMTASNEIVLAQINTVRENEQALMRNGQILNLLSRVAERQPFADSQEAWNWWDRYNETNYQSYKPQRYSYSSIEERVPQYVPPPPACECFAAGTLVMTHRGRRTIEQVGIGDMALSRDIETGKLSWQPVIAVTFQPPEKTFTIEVGEDSLTCTAGHLFWISGSGWKKASEIAKGDWMHGATEPIQVASVRPSETQPTFNLEILGQRTYFVGQGLVLSHDVTPRRTTRQLVPGYRPEQDNFALVSTSTSRANRAAKSGP